MIICRLCKMNCCEFENPVLIIETIQEPNLRKEIKMID